ncbi:MAG: ABC transporter substrate-binding protein [Xanthomonadaceae bacterium]|jgi:phospholipid transport system substrate-binding protein|nr:ABC transporter substrate-binding protein [Xanthomonadaceae bacterium]
MKTPIFSLLLGSALLAAVPAVAVMPQTAMAQSQSASQMVQASSQRILNTLEERRSEFRSNPAELQKYIKSELDAVLDRDYAARLILGVHARGAANDDIQNFANAMADNLMKRYGAALLNFEGRPQVQLRLETPLPGNRGVRVSTELVRQNNPSTPVDYLVRNQDGQWKIFDVMVEGVSYVQTFRNQFDAPLRQRTIAQVADDLRNGNLQLGN